ncbi:MAG TPA: SDR family oxidoreductase [Caldimonas sp.]|jgi:NAD(P)-dependent dehydrogenase (short-subunit alcohol dehydrogenase family)|nr:SDR family oxidoreductase [Caldimonas sp.]HEX2543116.1 SDR family oxidoreductase [Caldimonas sp.]
MTSEDHAAGGAQRTVLVTGGSRGIGAATCLLAARQGWAVAVNYARDRAAADAVVASIEGAGGRALALQGDVAEPADVEALFAAVDRELPPLGGLVNNAGVVDLASRVDAIGPERLQRMFAINVFGSFHCARQAILRMTTKPNEGARRGAGAHRGGAIVNVSSVAARLGGSGQYVDYAAAKGAIDTFTVGLAKEVVLEGIRVNAVRPGIIETDIHASGGQPDRVRQMTPLVPMQRAGTAHEVAEAIVWLLSDASSYTTGSIVDVSGGR